MEVFLSWSGTRARMLAQALSEWLPDVALDIDTWMSENDISAGSRWAAELSKAVEKCQFGVLSLTRENLAAPWLLFEAGCLGSKFESSRVIPYRLGVKAAEVEYPLAQFQGVDASKAGTLKLLDSLNRGRDAPLEKARLERVFEKWWPELQTKIAAIPKVARSSSPVRDDRELLEEILEIVRNQHAISLLHTVGRAYGAGFEMVGNLENAAHGISADVYWHEEGFTRDQALELSGVLKQNGILCRLAEHRDPSCPDSIFIGALVGVESARIALSQIPYEIKYLFRPDYPEEQGGGRSGRKLGIGYISTHYKEHREAIAEPVQVSEAEIRSLIAPGTSNVEFQRTLRRLTKCE